MMDFEEITVDLLPSSSTYHRYVAGCAWGPLDADEKWLALHGWLDNAASFEPLLQELLPMLKKQQLGRPSVRVICIDMTGHGKSPHRPPGAAYHGVDYAADAMDVITALGWQNERFTLLGHSLGGGVSTLLAGSLPGRIQRLILIESLGMFTAPEKDAPRMLEKSLTASSNNITTTTTASNGTADKNGGPAAAVNNNGNNGGGSGGIFRSVQDAAQRRAEKNVVGTLSVESALLLASRATVVDGVDNTMGTDAVRWSFDPRLRGRSRMYLSEPQVCAFLKRIECPTLSILAKDGMFVDITKAFKLPMNSQRLYWILWMILKSMMWIQHLPLPSTVRSIIRKHLPRAFMAYNFSNRHHIIPNFTSVVVPTGGHHCHMDAPKDVAIEIANWMS